MVIDVVGYARHQLIFHLQLRLIALPYQAESLEFRDLQATRLQHRSSAQEQSVRGGLVPRQLARAGVVWLLFHIIVKEQNILSFFEIIVCLCWYLHAVCGGIL